MIPQIIHLVCLSPFTAEEAKPNLDRLANSNPDYQVIVHTKPPDDFAFEGMPVSGPSGLCNLIRMEALRKWGGWYFDLDVDVRCNLKRLEKALGLGNNLAISQGKHSVCTFVSCCPENWKGWEIVTPYIKAWPSNRKGHYCTRVMGKLVKEYPYLCDVIPPTFTFSDKWLHHRSDKSIDW